MGCVINVDMSGVRVGHTNSHVLTEILITVQPVEVCSTKVREAELAKMSRLYLKLCKQAASKHTQNRGPCQTCT